jgi:hypothetical protein
MCQRRRSRLSRRRPRRTLLHMCPTISAAGGRWSA